MPAVRGEYAAVVLAGGAGRRLGGAGKPQVPVGGEPMLLRVLAAASGAWPTVVVGPPALPLPPGVRRVQEQPPGGGPAAAAAAGLAALPEPAAGLTALPEPAADHGAPSPAHVRSLRPFRYVALLAADLPLLTAAALARLRQAAAAPEFDGAVYVDGESRPQWLCGVWRFPALRDVLAGAPGALSGAPVGRLLGRLRVARLAAHPEEPPPWWDCDTGADLQRAEEWADGRTG